MEKPIPNGATHEIAGMYFKYGIHNKVYYWSDAEEEWMLSSRTILIDKFALNNKCRIKYGIEPWLRGDCA